MRGYGIGKWRMLLALVVGASVALGATMAQAQDVVLVVSRQGEDTSLSEQEIKDIYLGKKASWSDGTAIVLTVQEGALQGSFLSAFVGKTESQFSIFWKKQVFSGKGVEPKAFASQDELLKFVGSTKGAVGYAAASDTAAIEAAGCKVVTKK